MNYTNPINQSGNESKSEKRIDLMDDVNAYIELMKCYTNVVTVVANKI